MQERATIFGAEAERYDRTRPDYPAELVDALVPRAPMSVLDVGCGTGVAEPAARHGGCCVLGGGGRRPDGGGGDRAGHRGRGSRASRTRQREAHSTSSCQPGLALGRHPVTGPALPVECRSRWDARDPRTSPAIRRSTSAFDEIYDRFRLPGRVTVLATRARWQPAPAALSPGSTPRAGSPLRPRRSARRTQWYTANESDRSVAQPQRPPADADRAIESAAGRNPCRDRPFRWAHRSDVRNAPRHRRRGARWLCRQQLDAARRHRVRAPLRESASRNRCWLRRNHSVRRS